MVSERRRWLAKSERKLQTAGWNKQKVNFRDAKTPALRKFRKERPE